MAEASRDRRGSNKENIPPSPEPRVVQEYTGPLDLLETTPPPEDEMPESPIRANMPPRDDNPPRADMAEPPRAGMTELLDTPELTEEGESDDPRTDEVEAVEIEGGEEGEDDDEEEEEELDPFRDDDPTLHGLRLLNPLTSFHVSTYKPTCGVPALLAPDASQFWQSDGPQPHILTVHFFKTVHVLKFRLLLDWKRDESYTPTRMQFLAGTGEHDLVEFGAWEGERPRGWVDVALAGQGRGGGDGVWCRMMMVRVLENHQNGKDTHVRGVQVFGKDEKGKGRALPEEVVVFEDGEDGGEDDDDGSKMGGSGKGKSMFDLAGLGLDDEPDWMKEPQIR
ncbi:MAG: hypothetical protein LQ338_007477 [Usnochroma carphineum]|nr:MAG: hypothetical protein LQ338_007477 [Usnochroma carphineum]